MNLINLLKAGFVVCGIVLPFVEVYMTITVRDESSEYRKLWWRSGWREGYRLYRRLYPRSLAVWILWIALIGMIVFWVAGRELQYQQRHQ